jgi:phosphoglycolate phosphatase
MTAMNPIRPSLPFFVFDLDGTLFDTGVDLARSVNFSLHHFGLDQHPVPTIISFIGNGSMNLIRRSSGSFDEALTSKIHSHFLEHYLEHCVIDTKPYPGVLEFLQRPFRAALLTNKPYAPSLRILKHFGLETRFESILCGDTAPARKPAPDGLLQILKNASIAPAHALMVGDDPVDIHVAKAGGVPSFALRSGFGKSADLSALHPTFIADDFGQFAKEYLPPC